MKQIFTFLFILSMCLISLTSCSSDSGTDEESQGFAPGQLKGKTLILIKSGGGIFLSADHLGDSGVSINNVTVDYGKYAPSYSYSIVGTNKATKVTYIPYYGTNNYSKFSFDVDLNFTSKTRGTYTGTQTNANGKDSRISGDFTIN